MPGWYEATRKWVRSGRLAVIGVVQEQHADRASLLAQWKGLDSPILHDPINVMQAHAVPIIIAIDEHRIVRTVRPQVETFEQEFLDRKFSAEESDKASPQAEVPDLDALRKQAGDRSDPHVWRRLGDALVLWGDRNQINEAIDAYARCLADRPRDGDALFRLGVCYRIRHEGALRQAGDFQRAIDHWSRALETDPNQYIWRRRIQQYGPRLEKPYPFYDWVDEARKDVAARGEKPVRLAVEP